MSIGLWREECGRTSKVNKKKNWLKDLGKLVKEFKGT